MIHGIVVHIFSVDRLEAVAHPSSVAEVTHLLQPERGGAAWPHRLAVTMGLWSPVLSRRVVSFHLV